MPTLTRLGLILLLLVLVGGCIQPYRIAIEQGNVVTDEMLEKLKPGLTRSQVRFLLGTPLITDPFHPERWDYVHVYKEHAGAPARTRKLTVIFEGDTLARVEGDYPERATARDDNGSAPAEPMPGAPSADTHARAAPRVPGGAASP
ncbi:MAG TPA: outer membrane protein assembly factor BamE [Burkholderiales bacterium]